MIAFLISYDQTLETQLRDYQAVMADMENTAHRFQELNDTRCTLSNAKTTVQYPEMGLKAMRFDVADKYSEIVSSALDMDFECQILNHCLHRVARTA